MLVPWANCSGSGGLNSGLSFWAPLTSTIIPNFSAGSSTPTFTRATLRTCTDQDGIVRTLLSGEVGFQGARRVRNLVNNPENFAAGSWTNATGGVGIAAITTPNFGVAPDGTTTACRVQLNKNGGSLVGDFSGFQTTLAAGGATLPVHSCWLKTNDGTTKVVAMRGNGQMVVTVTGAWQRLTTTDTGAAAIFQLILRGTWGTADTADLLVWHPQTEDVTGQSNQNPGEYVSVGVLSSPFQGANVDGVQYFEWLNGNTVASNVVTAGTGAAIPSTTLLGYLAEEARTNLCLQSANFNNASWSKLDTVITTGNTTGPDGAASGDLLTEGVAGNAQVNQVITISANATCTASVFVKRGNSDWLQLFMLDNVTPANQVGGYFNINTGVVGTAINGGTGTGATLGIKAFPNGWYRLTLTGAVNNAVTAVRLQTNSATADGNSTRVNNSTRYQFGVQLEDSKATASSYIPTTTVAVTRNADVLTYPSAGNLQDAEGSAYAEFNTSSFNAGAPGRIIGTGTSGKSPLAILNLTSTGCYDGVTSAASNAIASVPNGITHKTAGTWSTAANRKSCNLDGGTPGTAVYAGAMTGGGIFEVGNDGNPDPMNGTVRNVRLWTRALADVQLQQITT